MKLRILEEELLIEPLQTQLLTISRNPNLTIRVPDKEKEIKEEFLLKSTLTMKELMTTFKIQMNANPLKRGKMSLMKKMMQKNLSYPLIFQV